MNQGALAAAVIRQPESGRILLRLAGTEIEESASDPQRLINAQALALKAASLSPWDYRNWRTLGLAQDSEGKLEEATWAMRIASKLAPNNSEVNWMLANLLIRQGNRTEALQAFRTATQYSNDLLPAAMEVVWQAFDNELNVLNSLVSKDASSQMMLAQFLLEQAQIDDAIKVYRGITVEAKLNSQSAAAFLSQLIKFGRGGDARWLWGELVANYGRSGAQEGMIWNGGFESTAPKNFGHFDWAIRPSDYARIGFDRNIFRSGQRSLRLNFIGRDTTKLMGDIQLMVILNANKKYRLECFAKATNLVTPEGPRIALQNEKGIVAISEPVTGGTTDWQHLVVEFTAPADSATAQVSIIKIPRFEYEEPTKGSVWFDDFKLTEM
ncbi:MAG: hypothetical protein JNK38_09200 [Acidobacteria bacterium]|nr:hypothetical protein [Acidobacteriota bacterium]